MKLITEIKVGLDFGPTIQPVGLLDSNEALLK